MTNLFYRVPKVCRHHWHPGPPFFLTFSFCRCIRAGLFCVFRAEGGSVSQQHSSTTVGPETAIFASALCSLGFTNFLCVPFSFLWPRFVTWFGGSYDALKKELIFRCELPKFEQKSATVAIGANHKRSLLGRNT